MAFLPTDLMNEINLSFPKFSYNNPSLILTWADYSEFSLVTLKKLHNRTPSIYEQLGFNVYFRRYQSQIPCQIEIGYEWFKIEIFWEFCQGWAHSVTFCCSWDESQKKIHVERLEIVSDINNILNIWHIPRSEHNFRVSCMKKLGEKIKSVRK